MVFAHFLFIRSICSSHPRLVSVLARSLFLSQPTMDREDVRCLILELTSVGNDLDKNDVADLYKACSILEVMSSARALDVVRSAGSRPALLTYMSDGWTTDVGLLTRASWATFA